MPDPYRLIDELYDAEHAAFDEDIDLLLAIAHELNGPILELGCGSGRILLPMAAAGHQVTGIDLSPAMLVRARHLLAETSTATLVQCDMRTADLAPGGPFAIAIYSLNGFMHLTSQDDQLASLAAVQRSLTRDGTVFLDLINPSPDYLERLAGSTVLEWQGDLPSGEHAQKWAHREVDVHDQTIETAIWYDLTMTEGLVRRIHTGFTLRFVHLAELALMLKSAGFGPPIAYGTYELDPLDAHSERMIVTAEKMP